MQRQILIAKSGISNHAAAGICDDPCLSSLEPPRTVSASQQTILGLLCVSLAAPDNRWHKCHLYVEQNITARSRCLSRHLPYF